MNAMGNNDRENVLAATDLVRLIGEHVQLRPKGREFAGLCPFHDDKNPSMQVSPQKQIYKCFSCGAGGTCFDFVMGYHKLTFPEALKMLADRAGIELTPFNAKGQGDGGQGGSGSADRRKRLLGVNELALAFFQKQLASPAGEQARDYLAKRGVSAEMIERFQLGYAPHSWHALAEAVTGKRWDKPAFENAGLIAQGQRGLYDKLRHRLVFPIGDRMGRPIAFGGRTLPGNELDDPTVDAKYLNSPETLLFNKSRTLYGLHLAQRAIGQTKTAVIVEGYTDVIACHQHGRCNVIAALGTAFTPEHATELRRICDKVVLVFDGDAAGHKAADRAVQVLLTSEIDAAVVMLPEGQDPDELLSSEGGTAAWDALIDGAQDTMRYLLDRFERELNDSDTITGRERAAEAFLTMLARHNVASTPGVRRSLVIAQVAQMLHMPEQEVLAELKRLKPRAFTPTLPDQASMDQTDAEPVDAGLADEPDFYETAEPSIPVSASVRRAIALAQSQLVACLLRDNNLFHSTMPDGADFCEAVAPGDVVGEAGRVFQLLHDRFADGETLTLAGVLVELAERGWDSDRRWLTKADVDLDPQVGEDPARLEHVFREAALALCRHRQRRAFEDDRRAVVAAPASSADPLALAGQAARLLEQRRNLPDPGRIARGAT